MRLLATGVLLVSWLWQGPAAAQKPSASTGDKVATEQAKPAPSHTAVVNPSVTAPTSQPDTAAQKREPNYDTWPWYFQPAWMIVWVTIAYTIIAWRMLRAIKRQANIMEGQAADARSDAANARTEAASTLEAIKRQGLSMRRQTTHLRIAAEAAKGNADAALLAARAQAAMAQQWFSVEGWNAIVLNRPPRGNVAATVRIQFRVCNRTDALMSFHTISARINPMTITRDQAACAIPPMQHIEFEIDYDISPSEISVFRSSSGVPKNAIVSADYDDVFNPGQKIRYTVVYRMKLRYDGSIDPRFWHASRTEDAKGYPSDEWDEDVAEQESPPPNG